MKQPKTPPSLSALFEDPERAVRTIQAGSDLLLDQTNYHHWDGLRHLDPPPGFTSEDWWYAIKLRRKVAARKLPLEDEKGRPLYVGAPDSLNRLLSKLDSGLKGSIRTLEPVVNTGTRDRFIASSLVEEAISSSMLEGAATTRRAAADMIRTGREPKGLGERMVHNNLAALEYIRSIGDQSLTPSRVLELHRIVTEDTLDDPTAAGRLRRSDEEIWVLDTQDNTVLHTPPPAEELEVRLAKMCEFAESKGVEYYLHPAVRSILLHYWLALDHPFVDGNGRTARALFYWSMRRHGFWLAEHVSISSILKQSPTKYGRSFQHVKTDDNDVTHFVYYQAEVILKGLTALEQFVQRKAQATEEAERMMRAGHTLNHRQLALLSHALRHSKAVYTVKSHQTSHRVVYQTARTDMLGLSEKGLLLMTKAGQTMNFTPPADLSQRLGEI